jgi:hypothetical protein
MIFLMDLSLSLCIYLSLFFLVAYHLDFRNCTANHLNDCSLLKFYCIAYEYVRLHIFALEMIFYFSKTRKIHYIKVFWLSARRCLFE